MRKFFQKFFFLDDAAGGAFLALTIWLLVPWLAANLLTTSSFTHWLLSVPSRFSSIPSLLLLATSFFALLVVYPMILFLRGIACHLSEIWKPRPLGTFASGVAMIAIAVICFLEGIRRTCFKYNLYFSSSITGKATSMTPDSHLDWCFQNLDWLYAILSLLLLVGGYLVIGKSFAIMEKTDFRKLFGKCVCGLWCIVLLVYAGTGIAALCSIARYHRTLEKASAFFEREMTVEALGELDAQGGTPDGEFWKAMEAERAKYALPPLMEGGPLLDASALVQELPQAEYEAWKAKVLAPEACDWLERRFANPLPPIPRDFSESANLAAMGFPELPPLRSLARREAWMTRFALEDHDSAALLASLRRSENAVNYLVDKPFVLSCFVAVACDTLRSVSLAEAIPTDLVDEAWLEKLILEMEEHETRFDEAQINFIFGELITIKNCVEHCFFLHSDTSPEDDAIRPAAYSWILPKLSDFVFSNLNEYVRFMTVRNFDALKDNSDSFTTKYMLPKLFIPALGSFANKIHEHQGVCREIAMLAKAELIKRRTGSYPQELPDVPRDPFNKEIPMQYLYGDFETKVSVWSPEEKSIVKKTRKIHGIKVCFNLPNAPYNRDLFIPVP
ncbi:MAG: hypothetical protein MJ202_02630 [Lentisphaeria bacterium]|nr:hypothetical protein [Lentisphaeria bacterium]